MPRKQRCIRKTARNLKPGQKLLIRRGGEVRPKRLSQLLHKTMLLRLPGPSNIFVRKICVRKSDFELSNITNSEVAVEGSDYLFVSKNSLVNLVTLSCPQCGNSELKLNIEKKCRV